MGSIDRSVFRRRKCSGFVLAAVVLLVMSAGVRAQDRSPDEPAPAAPAQPDAVEGQVNGATGEPQRLRLLAGQSQVIEPPWPVQRISLINPAIADVVVLSPRQVQVQAVAPGVTDLSLWSADDRVWRVRIEVELDLRRLEGQLAKVFPNSNLSVAQVGEVLVISGRLSRAEEAAQLRQLLVASELNHVDVTTVGGLQQVQLKVRVAEVSRQAFKGMNVNWLLNRGDFVIGNQLGSSSGPFAPINVGVPEGTVMDGRGSIPFTVGEGGVSVPPTATLFAGFPGQDLELFIQALAENQYLRLLAEPTLVAISGEEARFLAGGEIPIPVAHVSQGETQISIEYREFGIRLRFRPIVAGDGAIRLEVEPEVSELTDVGSITVLGARIPALITRRAVTTLELHDGQTFALAGLLNRSINARVSRVPGLGDLPILGTLFRSTRFSQGETELVILVTAELVEPQSTPISELPLPGMGYTPPNDWELFLLGRIEGRGPRVSPAQAAEMSELGLDKLRGPGAWASYERPPEGRRTSAAR